MLELLFLAWTQEPTTEQYRLFISPAPHTKIGAPELLYLQVRPEAGPTAAGRATDGNGQVAARGLLDVHPASDAAQRVSIEGGRRA